MTTQNSGEEERGGLRPISEEFKNLLPKGTGKALNDEVSQSEEYDCPICRDARIVHPVDETGKVDYSNVVPCKCIREQLEKDKARNLLKYCELPVGTVHMTFEGFKLTPELQEAYDLSLKLADGSDEVAWLTFMAGTNRGKTHLAVAICRRWLERGIPAKYAYVPLLLEELKRGFREDGDKSYESRFDRFLNVPLIVIDDLGTEYDTPWVQEKLDTIVDYRLMHGLCTVVTTNTPMDELPFRIAGRLGRLPNSRIVFIDAPEFTQ